jgi:hypothetical protein
MTKWQRPGWLLLDKEFYHNVVSRFSYVRFTEIQLMLQNRVDPFGNLLLTPARGHFTGTRGVIHNSQKEIVRPFKLKAWLTCLLEFKGRKRDVMTPDRYTELFFLDEATAFSAGHRPCAECRRINFNKFKTLWMEANPEYGFNRRTSIHKIDEVLHRERIDRQKRKVFYKARTSVLPNGTFVVHEDKPFLILNRALHLWTPFGYTTNEFLSDDRILTVLTPKSIVNTFCAGYDPQIAHSK